METFDFPHHVPTHVYPKGDSFKFGGGYEHAAAPSGPIQRRFTLSFSAMIWYKNAQDEYDPTIDPEDNVYRLIQFYEAHLTFKKFIYPHPVFGDLICRFATDAPFDVPAGKGGTGVTNEFQLTLVEQPL